MQHQKVHENAPGSNMAASHGTQDARRPVSRPAYPSLASTSISRSLWESFLPGAAFPPPPGGHRFSDHLSVTVVSPPELPQNKAVGSDALTGTEQKCIISVLEARCPNSGCQQGPTPLKPSGILSPLWLLLLFLGLRGLVSNPLASRGGLCVSRVHTVLPLRVCLSLCS